MKSAQLRRFFYAEKNLFVPFQFQTEKHIFAAGKTNRFHTLISVFEIPIILLKKNFYNG